MLVCVGFANEILSARTRRRHVVRFNHQCAGCVFAILQVCVLKLSRIGATAWEKTEFEKNVLYETSVFILQTASHDIRCNKLFRSSPSTATTNDVISDQLKHVFSFVSKYLATGQNVHAE
jgi:hypothetical protein